MAITSVDCEMTTGVVGFLQGFAGQREYTCTETHDNGSKTKKKHKGAKSTINKTIKGYYEDAQVSGLK